MIEKDVKTNPNESQAQEESEGENNNESSNNITDFSLVEEDILAGQKENCPVEKFQLSGKSKKEYELLPESF